VAIDQSRAGRDYPLQTATRHSGDRNYTLNLARALALAGADVTFMALVSEESDPDAYRREVPEIEWIAIDGAPRSALGSALSILPLAAARYATTAFGMALRNELARSRYHCAVIDHYALGWALDELRACPGGPSCLVYISHDYEIDVTAAIAHDFSGGLPKKAFLYANAWKTARIERHLVRHVDILTAITEEDGANYLRLNPKRRPVVLRPGFAGYRRPEREINASTPRRVVVLGSFLWIAKQMNLDRFLEAADGPFAEAGIELEIVGVVGRELQERWKNRLRATRFLGFVDDLQSCFDNARMGLVVEATGGGFKFKTLDYVFGRVPVAALTPTLRGLDRDIRAHFIVADELAALVQAIRGTINDIGRLNAMQRGAFLAVRDRFEWKANGRTLLESMETCRRRHPALIR